MRIGVIDSSECGERKNIRKKKIVSKMVAIFLVFFLSPHSALSITPILILIFVSKFALLFVRK